MNLFNGVWFAVLSFYLFIFGVILNSNVVYVYILELN